MLTSVLRPRLPIALAATAAATFVAIPLATPAFAGVEHPMPLYGEVDCNEELGMNGIIWELQNDTGEVVSIDDAVLFGAISGPENSWTVDPIQPDGASFAFTIVTAGVTGDISLAVSTSWLDGEFPMDADSVATVTVGECDGPTSTTTTSTTTAAPTTTTPPATVAAVVATPRFTG